MDSSDQRHLYLLIENTSKSLPQLLPQFRVLERQAAALQQRAFPQNVEDALEGIVLTMARSDKRHREANTYTLRNVRHSELFEQFIAAELEWVESEIVGSSLSLSERALQIQLRATKYQARDVPKGTYRTKELKIFPFDKGGKIAGRHKYLANHLTLAPELIESSMAAFDDYKNWPLNDEILPGAASRGLTRAALMAHLLMYIHPFEDGNGRAARLLSHATLIEDGFPPAYARFAISLANAYRLAYYRALNTSDRKMNSIHYVRFALSSYLKLFFQIRVVSALHVLPGVSSVPASIWRRFFFPVAKMRPRKSDANAES